MIIVPYQALHVDSLLFFCRSASAAKVQITLPAQPPVPANVKIESQEEMRGIKREREDDDYDAP